MNGTSRSDKRMLPITLKYLKPTIHRGITQIKVDHPNGTTRIVTDAQDVFNQILKQNHAHFSQATGTPFTKTPLNS
jgi:hypothetical protein